ncbi:MAG: TRAP transporter large permease [Vicinamibacterales bacterium]|jgi:tripartite ATP-independent transporter DctM subunit|nr:hypothetical protein [Acidobacteriota bacterium]MDP7295510.1 TRAP transporter large permease [Vicinamibacterales bacterium]MDP7672395.1 TRAP transporter large permease [Vicinamibacterales bacterium]HJO37505.1 TRAP transporter large permease [Vicinamibacterales bacterium]
MATLTLVVSFILLLALNVPVAFAIGIATALGVVATSELPGALLVAQRMATGIDSFTLLAIPFFILAGLLMGQGGIARRLIDLADVLVGRLRGGLSSVTILTCMLFGSVSGSAAAAVSSIGSFMVPAMNERNDNPPLNTAIVVTASTTGLLIPPSNIMIIYAMATGGAVSVAAIFLAGVVPGVLVGLALMAVAAVVAPDSSGGTGWSLRELVIRLGRAVPALAMVVIVLGGIVAGVFTATEASAIAVLYALVLSLGVYREVGVRELPALLLRCGVITSVVMLLVGASSAMAWILAYENVPQVLGTALLRLSDDPVVILLLINIFMLAAGTVIDMTPAVLLFTPIFWPVVLSLGIDPLHFGVVLIMNLCIGLCTPPVGTCLFLGCGIGDTTVPRMLPKLLPFYAAMIAALLLTTLVPSLTLALPRALGAW